MPLEFGDTENRSVRLEESKGINGFGDVAFGRGVQGVSPVQVSTRNRWLQFAQIKPHPFPLEHPFAEQTV